MPNALRECTVPLVLKKIGKDKMSGCLSVTVEGGVRQLFFDKGRLCSAQTNDPDLRLGAVLVSTGSISPIDLNLFDPMLKFRHTEKIGSVLEDLGLISTPILKQGLITQMVRIAADLFPRTIGHWDFDPTRVDPAAHKDMTLSISKLMIEGVKSIEDFSFYQHTFASVSPKPSELVVDDECEITPVQRRFIAKVGRLFPTPNREMPEKMEMKETLYWRAILLFFLLGKVEFINPKTTQKEIEQKDSSIIRISRLTDHLKKVSQERQQDDVPVLELTYPDLDEANAAKVSVDSSENLVSLEEIDPEKNFELAEKEFANRNFVKALSLIEEAINKGPVRPKYYQLLGRTQMQFPKLRRDAEDTFLNQAKLEPWNADPYYHLGELYQLEGFYQRAEKQFEKALELNLDHTKAGMRMNQLNPRKAREFTKLKKRQS